MTTSKKDPERQPLQTEGSTPYGGGQPQNETELFAEHQGSEATPWWLSHFLVSERVLFGTWDGVYTSCLINIFGVIVFLRSGWMVAQAGIGGACLIVVSAVALILLAVMSAIGICERCHVQSGGVYFLISHVLGSRRGAAIGIIYIFGQAIGNALCATGFGETIAGAISESPSPLVERSVAALVIIVLTCINFAGVKWVVRLQFVLLVILLLGAVDFGLGSFRHPEESNGFIGWNGTLAKENYHSKYIGHHNWFTVFGVFFPALTGVMAGINMSGDLRNPSEDIAIGTLSALGSGLFIYLLFVVVLGGTCERTALLNDYMIAEKVSLIGFLLLSALYISSVSSCLATLYGTPRVLQSIAGENMIPAIRSLAVGKGPNQVPFNALLLISAITLVFIGIGEINRLATLATMPFLMTYGVIEYSYFALCMQFDLNQKRLSKFRASGIGSPPTFVKSSGTEDEDGTGSSVVSDDGLPERKSRIEEFEELLEKYNVDEIEEKPRKFYSPFCNRWLSLAGFVIKCFLMIFIHWGYCLLSITICLAIWFYIGRTAPGVNPGIAAEFSFFKFLQNAVSTFIFGEDAQKVERDQMVVTPILSTVKTQSSQLNDVNTDFANRSQFHQTSTVKGLKIDE